ncbi:glycosyltransferase family 4 protein [soil metagenome]
MRVLHLPHNIGGQASGLAKAESAKGILSRCVVIQASRFAYPDEWVYREGWRRQTGQVGARLYFFFLCIFCADVIHFNFGEKIFPFGVSPFKKGESIVRSLARLIAAGVSKTLGSFDLWLLKKLGKKIFVSFQGDDVRQGDFCRENFPIHFAHHVGKDYYDAASDARKRRQVRIWDRYADRIFYLNPDLKWVLPERSEFLAYASVDARQFQTTLIKSACPVVIHAPSHRLVKGSGFIEDAVIALRKKNLNFEFQLLENLPFETARLSYRRADVVVDQLLAGWYGAFAVEAMAMGKPVIAYIREADLVNIPFEMAAELPIINATPETIEDVLQWAITNPDRLREIGIASRKFVEKWHDPTQISKRTLS